ETAPRRGPRDLRKIEGAALAGPVGQGRSFGDHTRMNCPSCGAQNRPEGKFCSECGAPLTRACSSCGAALRPGAKFCDECGSVVVAPDTRPPAASTRTATAPTAERRLVSVLFADLVRFTTLSESRDSEDVRELLSRYFE